MELTEKQLDTMRNCLRVQGTGSNWEYNGYINGYYDGMELMMAIVEDRKPVFKAEREGDR